MSPRCAMRQTRIALLATVVGLLGAACGPDVVVYRDRLRRAAPKTIAVLPFTYQGANAGKRAHMRVAALRGSVHRRLASLPYLHLETEEVDRRLAEAGLDDARALAKTPPRRLGRLLGVDALLYGDVTTLSNLEAGVF